MLGRISPQMQFFDAAGQRSTLHTSLPDGLVTSQFHARWHDEWRALMKVSPEIFYATMTQNIPGHLTVYVNVKDTGLGTIDLSLQQNGRTVFESEGNKITSDCLGYHLRFEEWKVKDASIKGHGICLNLFKNFYSFAGQAGIDDIALRAGYDDGKVFWARRGFYLKDRFYIDSMVQAIRENLLKRMDTLRSATVEMVRDIIDQPDLDMNWRLVRLPEEHGGKLLARQLMDGYNPEYRIDFHNAEQMARVQHTLSHPVVPPSGFTPL